MTYTEFIIKMMGPYYVHYVNDSATKEIVARLSGEALTVTIYDKITNKRVSDNTYKVGTEECEVWLKSVLYKLYQWGKYKLCRY